MVVGVALFSVEAAAVLLFDFSLWESDRNTNTLYTGVRGQSAKVILGGLQVGLRNVLQFLGERKESEFVFAGSCFAVGEDRESEQSEE